MKKTILASISLASLALFLARAEETAKPCAADRQAILGMAGEYAVEFNFRETLALMPNYTLKKPYTEEAEELVVVTEDTPNRIALQHILLVGGRVVKHWGQIWTYEDERIWEFQGHATWKLRTLTSEERRGTWSQYVTQVDDSPRYESWGRWEHAQGASTWTSKSTWRPLPRREHTTRKDYDVLAGINRQVITPDGWAHEQDNTKLIVRGDSTSALAREFGLNTYRRLSNVDFTPVRDFWTKQGKFWGAVNASWKTIMDQRAELTIHDGVDVPGLRKALKELQKETENTEVLAPKIAAVLEGFLQPTPPPAAAKVEPTVPTPVAEAAKAEPAPASRP